MENQYTSDALFRHELAFILGQLRNKAAIGALIANIENPKQHYVVRHECAFALGSAAGSQGDERPDADELREIAKQTLHKHSADSNRVVAESCLVGLDMMDYEAGTQLHPSEQLMKELEKK